MTVVDGRQWATTLDEIRKDHVERYRWASGLAKGLIADLGCGIGYGSKMLADAGHRVCGYEKSVEALQFAEQHWNHPSITWMLGDLNSYAHIRATWAVAFEVIEHLEHPVELLKVIQAARLLCSVPNEDVMPFDRKRHSYHHRHYRRHEFGDLLTSAGWHVLDWYGQIGKTSPVELNVDGMTTLAICERAE